MPSNEKMLAIDTKVEVSTVDEISGCSEEGNDGGGSLTGQHHVSDAPNTTQPRQRRWRSGWAASLIRFGPVSGLFGMLLAFTSIIACLGILVGSENRNIQNWTTPPSTYLALFTAIANGSMRYAAGQGLVVAWWMRAMKGSELSTLHYDWRSGSSLLGALTAGRRMGLLGLACVCSTFVVVDGPLLQRASTVVRHTVNADAVPLSVTMAPELPHSFTGRWATAAQWHEPGWLWSVSFNETVPLPHGTAPNNIVPAVAHEGLEAAAARLWVAEEPLENVINGCRGQCKAKIQTPALFETACTTHEVRHEYLANWDVAAFNAGGSRPPLDTYEFMIDMQLVLDESEKLVLITGFTQTQQSDLEDIKDCNTTFIYKTCLLEAGIGEYEVIVDDDKIITTDLGTPTLVALSNNTEVDYSFNGVSHPSTLAGVVVMLAEKWTSWVASWGPPKGAAPIHEVYGPATEQYWNNGTCHTYNDARKDVVASLNKLIMFFGALAGQEIAQGHHVGHMDPNTPAQTTTLGYPFGKEDVFATHYAYFIAAAAVELICILLVAPTYWGWWRLGRPMSFSPLEIAKAFQSPLLAEYNSNSTEHEIARTARGHHVQYGVIPPAEDRRAAKLAFEDTASCKITQPDVGQTFGN